MDHHGPYLCHYHAFLPAGLGKHLLVDKRRVAAHMMATFWAWHYQSLIPFWKLHIEGRKKIPWRRPVVMVANHRSLIDILALYKIRRPYKWTSKEENFKLPFIGMVL